MANETIRTHVLLPRELVEEVDRAVGQRRRSHFIGEAVQEKLTRQRRTEALRRAAGSIDLAEYPAWSTPEKISAWVHDSRARDDARARQGRRS